MEVDWKMYFSELRKRLLICFSIFIVVFAVNFYFSNILFWIATRPLSQHFHQTFIATHLLTMVLTPMNLAFYAAIFFTMPLFLFHLWQFIAPALYFREKKISAMLLSMSVILFYLGVTFAYFVVLPLVTRFLLLFLPKNLTLFPEISQYISFSQSFLLLFGFLFEIPLLMFFLSRLNIVSFSAMKKFRRYYIVAAFFIGMLLTPPDVLSQVLVAVPMWLLYEAGLLLLHFSNENDYHLRSNKGDLCLDQIYKPKEK